MIVFVEMTYRALRLRGLPLLLVQQVEKDR